MQFDKQLIHYIKKLISPFTTLKGIEKPDLNNLESILIISNKDYYLRLAKEKAIDLI